MFTSQVDRLVRLGYPALARRSEQEFRALLEPLREIADALRASYVVVVTRDLVAPEDTVPLLRLTGSDVPGVVDRNHAPGGLALYEPIAVSTPPASTYLLVDVERGEEFCNVRPEDATMVVLERGRSPLTIDEGIAVV
ncbi:MAG: hypothetical protein JWO46_1439, partial [Nocardioidaceae bacterium]|nr:hypothetical protein [Nocardioidaceae bacterium]